MAAGVLQRWARPFVVLMCLTSTADAASSCDQVLGRLRGEAQKRAAAIEIAVRDNASAAEKCKQSSAYLAADGQVLAYMKSNKRRCGIGALLVTQQEAVHDSNRRARDVLCTASPGSPHP
ncbi:MAG: hypothetical protein JO000_04575 [Alphaproteobacteria bacterium]|nr:hypothetical protein [Alphaproteobacteria bacterium]